MYARGLLFPALTLFALTLFGSVSAVAQDAPAEESEIAGTPLATYLDAMAERRLLAAETGSADRLRELVVRGEALYLEERYDDAALVLFEVAESPRFADFVDLDEFAGAEYMLARSLERLGALRTAARYLENIMMRGPEDLYFGPSVRAFVDVGLNSGNPAEYVERLEAVGGEDLPEDAGNELSYLKGRAAYDADNLDEARQHFEEVTRRSRFYANSHYLMGVMSARAGELDEAEEMFCSIAETGDDDRYTFFVDDRYFEVKDLAHLALGRIAHEGERSDDAFYYYFQVPNDSERVAEALFESAFAMYEGGDYETSVDLLDQLEVRFPESAFSDEASLLRGYVHLGRCEFQKANELFQAFSGIFEPVVQEINRILENPARQRRLYEELLVEEDRVRDRLRRGDDEEDAQSTKSLLLTMLRVDPDFYRLHADVRILDSEAARAGRLSQEMGAILARVQGGDTPRAAAEDDNNWDEVAELRTEVEAARSVMSALTEQLDTMRGEASEEQLAPLETEVQGLGERLEALETQFEEAVAAVGDGGSHEVTADGLEGLIERDVNYSRRLPARIEAVRAQMVRAGNQAAMSSLRDLHARLGGGLRRARIGRIDAVMGSKRRVEIQIESLAAGRFPAELQDPLALQGLLRDDEEYWPFEGELWQDEFDEADPIEDLLEDEGSEGQGSEEG